MTNTGIKQRLLQRAAERPDEKILNYLVENFNAVTFMSAEKLCYAAGCTEKELQRFCAAFGVRNLLELMTLLRQEVYDGGEESGEDQERALRNISDMVVHYEMENISNYVSMLDVELLDRLARDMCTASEVYVLGVRSTAPMAVYAAHILSAAGIKTRKLDVAENYVDGVVNMDRSGLVLALDFTRYHRGTLVLLNMLRKSGFTIATITDSPDAPVAKVGDYSLFVPRRSYDYTDSFVATTMLLNTLAIYIGMQDKEALVSRLRQYDETAQSLEFFF